MARIRTVKPDLFRHEALYEAEQETGLPIRLAYIGMFTVADREGRFKWKPRQIKLDVMPYDDIDFEKILNSLCLYGFIIKYEDDNGVYGHIPSWEKHQVINKREAQSLLPHPDIVMHVHAHEDDDNAYELPYKWKSINNELRETIYSRDGNKCVRCGSENDLTIDHIFPQSIGGTHVVTNLRTLCRSCNSARPVAGQALIDDLKNDGFTLNDMQRTCTHSNARGEEEGKRKGREEEGKYTLAQKTKDFELFWKAYPKKKSKADALKAYKSAKNIPDIDQLIDIIEINIASLEWQKDGGKYIPYPASWIRAEGWNDEITTPRPRYMPANGVTASSALDSVIKREQIIWEEKIGH